MATRVFDGAEMAMRGRIGAYSVLAKYDSRALTEKARATFRDGFIDHSRCKLCRNPDPIPIDLPPEERARRAEALRRGHYARLALRSARARRRT